MIIMAFLLLEIKHRHDANITANAVFLDGYSYRH